MFKASENLNTEGNKQIITREPGIYQVKLEKIEAGSKRAGKDEPEIPTLDVTVKVVKVNQLHDKTIDAASIVGKSHTDQIKLDITTQDDFNKKVGRIAHILTKAGIDKADILAVGFDPSKPDKYQAAIAALFDPAKHNKVFNFKVIGNVYSGAAFTQAPGYLGFATEQGEEQKFSSQEIKGNNAYYAALNGQTPSAEGDSFGAGAGTPAMGGQAF